MSLVEDFNTQFPKAQREWKSLRNKYKSLYTTKVPTGDPHCPPPR
jgi:hypothetical protein